MTFAIGLEVVREVYAACRSSVVRTLARAGGVEPDDIAQDVLIKAIEKSRRGGGGIHAVSGRDVSRYARRMARTTAIDAIRETRRKGETLCLDERWVCSLPNPEQRLMERERDRERGLIGRRISQFPSLRSGSSYSSKAERCGVHPSTMSRRARKALEIVRYETVQIPLPFSVEPEGGDA